MAKRRGHLLKEIIPLHKKELKPVRRHISFQKQIQLGLWGINKKSHVKMGAFYELLTAGLFGGDMSDVFQIIDKQNGNALNIQPDVLDIPNGRIGESKALCIGHQFNIMDDQIENYLEYQRLYPEMKIYYALWRHSLKGIMKYKGQLQELWKELSNLTHWAIVLPFRIIITMWKHSEFKRYENDKWFHCTRVSSAIINNFITHPKMIVSHIGLNPKEFSFNRYITPKDLTIEDNIITPFPIIVIKDKFYTKWVKESIKEEIPF